MRRLYLDMSMDEFVHWQAFYMNDMQDRKDALKEAEKQ